MQVAQEAETGNIGAAVNIILLAAFCGVLVQTGHGFNGSIHGFLGSLAHTMGSADDANTQLLGDDQLVTGVTTVVGVDPVGANGAHDGQAVLDVHIIDGVTADQNAAGFDNLFGATTQNLAQHVDIPALGEADDVHCGLDFTAHCIYVAEGVGGSNLAEGIGIIHHGGEEVNSLDDTDVIGDFIYGCVIGTVKADQQVGIILALGQLA